MNWNWKITSEEQKLVTDNMKLVKTIINKHFNRIYDIERADLMQMGYLGLIWAAHFFVIRRAEAEIIDCNFTTFAWSRIVVFISRELNTRKDSEKLVKVVKKFMSEFYLLSGRHLSLREVSIVFEVPETKIRETLNEYNNKMEALDDAMEHEADSRPFTDDRLSPLDLAILKEEHLLLADQLRAKRIKKRQKLIEFLK